MVSFGVLINGSAYGNILPSRGLRQGEPLSPFLFILCTEMLANGLRQADLSKKIHGIRLGYTGPSISHLLFADDSIFFIRANKEEALALRHTLRTYEKLSGQKVNLSKSSLTFGSQVTSNVRSDVTNIMGVVTTGGKCLYLGLPEVFIGSKTATLSFLEKRLHNRINSWKNRYLSNGGKETLIKAVALSLPTYSMSCFKLPKGIYSRISSMLASFWWKNSETSKGIHWSSWEKCTRSKKEGGLGFRDVEGFNQALLGKQLWRLANNPTSLLARTLKSRYYARDSVLTAKVGSRPSYAWRSLQGSQELMLKGMKKDFGDGAHISLLEDPWLADPMPRPPEPKIGIDSQIISLHYLKHQGSDEWNIDNLKEVFDPRDVTTICKTFTTPTAMPFASYSWIHNKDGRYSVKSGYWLWASQMHSHRNLEFGPNYLPLYEAIWKVKAPPKILHFLWRCLSGGLAVGTLMASRQLIKDSACPFCGLRETINHSLFECGFARVVWASSKAGYLFYPFPSGSLFVNVASCLAFEVETNSEEGQRLKSWPWILWRIWKARNDLCFNNRHVDARALVSLADEDARGWDIINTISPKAQTLQPQPLEGLSNRSPPPSKDWQKPPIGYLKCNTDGAWLKDSQTCGTGWCLRDEAGRLKWNGMKTYPNLDSPIQSRLQWYGR